MDASELKFASTDDLIRELLTRIPIGVFVFEGPCSNPTCIEEGCSDVKVGYKGSIASVLGLTTIAHKRFLDMVDFDD